mmetsp:Transcript_78203/g.242873  ORF Transcript_78203/g.242873 Transcript_78203/m.242873 type:complete len:160 (-) Transcript_78203:93-572(-)
MQRSAALALLLCLCGPSQAALLRGAGRKPIFEGRAATKDGAFGASVADGKPRRMPGYRSAWDDCGGVGASDTEKMRVVAAKIKGWAKPLPFKRHAAQDCNRPDQTGTVAGPHELTIFPAPEIPGVARQGLAKAADTLKKYPAAAAPPRAEYVGHLFHDM